MRTVQCLMVLVAVAVLMPSAVSAQKQPAMDKDAKRALWESRGSVPTPAPEPAPPVLGTACQTEGIAGALSWELIGDPLNEVRMVDASTCTSVDDVAWTGMTLTTFSPSWADEPRIRFTASDLSSPQTAGPFGSDTTVTSLPVPDGSVGGPVVLLGDNILRMEFYETGFNDFSSSPDASYPSGEIEAIGVIIPVELTGFEVE